MRIIDCATRKIRAQDGYGSRKGGKERAVLERLRGSYLSVEEKEREFGHKCRVIFLLALLCSRGYIARYRGKVFLLPRVYIYI